MYAERAAEASECAHQQDKFFEYIDLAYQNQMLFTNSATSGTASTVLENFAAQLGLRSDCFNPCLTGGGEASRAITGMSMGLQLVLRLCATDREPPLAWLYALDVP